MTLVLFLWSFVQSTITSIAIGTVKKTHLNYILSSIFAAMATNTLLQYLFRFTDLKHILPEMLFLCDVIDLLLPGLILWYINTLFGNKITKKQYWYFLPSVIAFLLSLVYIVSIDSFTFSTFIGSPVHITLLSSIVLWKSFVLYKIYSKLKSMKNAATAKQQSELLWPRILMFFVAMTLYVALLLLAYHTTVVPLSENTVHNLVREIIEVNYILFNSSIIFITMFFVLKHPKALSGNTITIKAEGLHEDSSMMKYYIQKLNHMINEEKVHLETELNEKMLAEKLEIHSYLLSKLLNDHIGKSFSEYINEKRVKHAMVILENDVQKSLTNFAVAVDSGFRSESVFYVNFKKYTGLTPRQYRLQTKKVMNAS